MPKNRRNPKKHKWDSFQKQVWDLEILWKMQQVATCFRFYGDRFRLWLAEGRTTAEGEVSGEENSSQWSLDATIVRLFEEKERLLEVGKYPLSPSY